MAEYQAPGVYVEEVERGAKPIEGVSTSTVGFLGETERGRTDPQLVTSYGEFKRAYGGLVEDRYLAQAVDAFFTNGGSRCYVGRITAAEETASAAFPQLQRAEGQLDVSPASFDFGSLPIDGVATATITFRNRGAGDDPSIRIDGITQGENTDTNRFQVPGGFTADDGTTVVLGAGEEHEVEVEYHAGSGQSDATHDGALDVTFVVATDDGWENQSSTETVALDGQRFPNAVTVTPGQGPFQPTMVGETATREVTIANETGNSIDVVTTEVVGPQSDDFDVEPAVESGSPETVADGDELVLDVTAAPAEAGERAATLSIDHDASSDSPDVEVPLEVQGVPPALGLSAVGPGDWGGRISVHVRDATLYAPGENDLFKLVVRYWSDAEKLATARDAYDPTEDVDEAPEPAVAEVYDNLSPVESSSDFVEKQLGGSEIVELADDLPIAAGERPQEGVWWLDGEFDPQAAVDGSAPDLYSGPEDAGPGERTGLRAFEEIDGISILCVPDEHSYGTALTDVVTNHCEELQDRFAILQAAADADDPGTLSPPRDSSYAAFYYPWVEVRNPETGREELMPPGGHVAGVYARTDGERGVHKAPANEGLRKVQSLQHEITKAEQEVLNPKGVNCIRSFRGRGIRIWGARTTSSDPLWKYVNVRRLFLYLEESIDEGTQWVVFEPNDEQLWARVRQTIKNFLTQAWNDGALMGSTPEEAFYVKCDRSTMTQSDIDDGKLICEIGVAPVKPAEFVVFRISQWTGGVEE